MINGQSSESRPLPQAGLPQGSPLSPMLFLFFNADLVQTQIDKNGGAIAFVDDYTAWVSGPTAQSNRRGIQAIIDKALDWERRSGATFEAEKTAIIHFTRYTGRVDSEPFTIKGERVSPKDQVKGARSCNGTETPEGDGSLDNETALYSHGSSRGRLCLQRLDACVQNGVGICHSSSTKSRSTGSHRIIYKRGYRGS
ncbi:Myosin heavy chain kinase B [Fusarium oxysporum f. sp. albedinis]|nr:Myosin heavy chain kinase B [Fusarium oxysporum f. sp. albedinis]